MQLRLFDMVANSPMITKEDVVKNQKKAKGAIVTVVCLVGLLCNCSSDLRETSQGMSIGRSIAASTLVGQQLAHPPSDAKFHVIAPTLGASRIPGFRMSATASRFALGASARVEEDAVSIRHVGTQGVFAELSNGFVKAGMGPDAASAKLPPLTTDSALHNERVRAYFSAAGLPADQVARVRVNALMHEEGSYEDSKKGLPPTVRRLIGFNSIVDRSIDGVLVRNSHAWARFNSADEVVAEEVWWPELPAELHDEVAAFKSVTENNSTMQQYREGLPEKARSAVGVLCVHHPLPLGYDWYLHVTYDVMLEGENYVRSFDRSGREVRFEDASTKVASSGSHPL